MDPIISPWFLYLIDIIENFSYLLRVCSITTAALSILFTIICLVYADDCNGTPKIFTDNIKMLYIITIVLGVTTCLIPSRGGVIAMAVANEITTDRVSGAGDLVVDIKNSIKLDIIEIISEFDKDIPAEVGE